MGHWHYLVMLAGCLVVTAPLEALGTGVYRRPRRMLAAVAPVAAVFVAWDLLAVRYGVWHFDSRYLIGLTVPGGLPIEEVLFFLVVPICGLLTYEAVTAMTSRIRQPRGVR